MAMKHKAKKAMKIQQIKMGKTTKKERSQAWAYILYNDLSVGYVQAQDLAKKGVQILKSTYREDQPD